VTKPTPQQASGSTIVSADNLRLDRIGTPTRSRRRSHARRGRGRCRLRGRADAPTAPWKTADRFPQRPPPFSSSSQGETRQTDLTHGQRPASDNYRAPLRSPASSFADPSPADLVVLNRERVSGASESGAARPLPYPNPGRGRVTVNGLVTQPHIEGAGIGPTSIKTHGFISGGGGACPDSWATPVEKTRLQARTTQVGRASRRILGRGLDTGDGVMGLGMSAQGLPKKPASVFAGSTVLTDGRSDTIARRRSDPLVRSAGSSPSANR